MAQRKTERTLSRSLAHRGPHVESGNGKAADDVARFQAGLRAGLRTGFGRGPLTVEFAAMPFLPDRHAEEGTGRDNDGDSARKAQDIADPSSYFIWLPVCHSGSSCGSARSIRFGPARTR